MEKTLRRLLLIVIILIAAMAVLKGRATSQKKDLRRDALLYFHEEDYTKAIEYLEKALKKKGLFDGKLNRDIKCYLAESYYCMEKYSEAEKIYQQLQKEDSDNPLYYLQEGLCCKDTGDYDKAMKIFQKGWDKTEDPAFLSRICEIYIEQKKYKKALNYARKGIKEDDNASAELMYELIIIYEESQNYKKAYQAAKDYCKKYPDDEKAKKELLFLSSRV
ncbi:MAG: tetratricopeptide repeat protein [Eubacterium sp.]|nr:tetratricopeptide repeat protein [Eubacterium sp.]